MERYIISGGSRCSKGERKKMRERDLRGYTDDSYVEPTQRCGLWLHEAEVGTNTQILGFDIPQAVASSSGRCLVVA
jgi:hypothetical protein